MVDAFVAANRINTLITLLGHLGKFGVLMNARLAPWLGKLWLEAEGQPLKVFRGANPPFEMIQSWVCNKASREAVDVRAEIRWRVQGKQMPMRGDTPGAWCPSRAPGIQSFAGSPTDAVTMSSNGRRHHLGLLVKYPGDSNAYIVTEHGYQMGNPRRWEIPSLALPPGRYEAEIMFTAIGGNTGSIRIEVWNDGANGTIGCDVVPKSTIKP